MTFAMVFAFIGGSLAGAAGLFCMAVIAAALQEHRYLQRELDRAAGGARRASAVRSPIFGRSRGFFSVRRRGDLNSLGVKTFRTQPSPAGLSPVQVAAAPVKLTPR
jgi:hypothetical protein